MSNDTLILSINGTEHALAVSPERTLLDVLREELDLVGAREGCGIGMCGTCTILVDGRVMKTRLIVPDQRIGFFADHFELEEEQHRAMDRMGHQHRQFGLDHGPKLIRSPGFVTSPAH